MTRLYNRRQMLKLTGSAVGTGIAGAQFSFSAEPGASPSDGLVAGEINGAATGNKILKQGGNAIDAIVGAALVSAIAGPARCGIGGYGGHMIISLSGGKKITAIDFNSTAPAAAKENMFPLDERGAVRGKVNDFGWLAAGVPGTLAGLALALDRYGTRPFREIVALAIELAREGFIINQGLSNGIRSILPRVQADPASAMLLLKNGEPLQVGERFVNPDLAQMLETLAKRNSVDSFYRGDIAGQIAAEFGKHGGLVTTSDLAAYHAREVEPLRFKWGNLTLWTAPLTAGGLTIIEALSILKDLNWSTLPAGPERTFARLEALRLAWSDRLQLLGDPEKVKVPVRRLLSDEYAHSLASKVQGAVREHKPLALQTESRSQSGTTHLNSIDGHGNMVSLTLTHGNSFGACVTVEGLGLTLGHGMSRFNPQPGHPNSPGPGKRPLHNMCPTIVLRDSTPVLAIGGTGGRMIPNAIFDVLTHYIALGASLDEAIAAPRLHTEGNLHLRMEPRWSAADVEYFKTLGYTLESANSANVQALSFDPRTGAMHSAAR